MMGSVKAFLLFFIVFYFDFEQPLSRANIYRRLLLYYNCFAHVRLGGGSFSDSARVYFTFLYFTILMFPTLRVICDILL